MVHSWAAKQSREHRLLLWRNIHSSFPPHDLPWLGSSFFHLCKRVLYMWGPSANWGKSGFRCGDKRCGDREVMQNLLPINIMYNIWFQEFRMAWCPCQKFSGLKGWLCTLWLPVASLTVRSMPRTWVIDRKECALWFHAPKHTQTHS